jgi:hypothetical protein
MNERLVDLEEELKKMADINNNLSLRAIISNEEVSKCKHELQAVEKRAEEARAKLRDTEKQRERQDFEVDFLKKENLKLARQME